MKICAAQTRPVTGDIVANIEGHKKLIAVAVSDHADLIIFPELSLTGYEPSLAASLATDPYDTRLDDFQRISDLNRITIGVGLPVKSVPGISISMIIFQPNQSRQVYYKKYLHPDEEAFFISGFGITSLTMRSVKLSFGICYEISVQEHLETALATRPHVYIASVVKFDRGIDNALKRLSAIAYEHKIIVLMSNSVGKAGGGDCAGLTAVWDQTGTIKAQLDDVREGIVMIETETMQVTQVYAGSAI